jgi:hypothetical protein
VLDSEDNDIYRQLAGGVTSSHLLHGSANPNRRPNPTDQIALGARARRPQIPELAGLISNLPSAKT